MSPIPSLYENFLICLPSIIMILKQEAPPLIQDVYWLLICFNQDTINQQLLKKMSMHIFNYSNKGVHLSLLDCMYVGNTDC